MARLCARTERGVSWAWLLCSLLVLGVALQPSAARAQESESAVVIVRVPGDETIISRLRAELSSYRFRAIELTRRSEALSQLALQREAQAALRARPDAMAVELWVRAAGGNAPPSEEVVTAGPGRDPEVLALRVTEAMRARGLKLPPLSAASQRSGAAPAADSGGRGTPSPAPEAEVGVAEPHTLAPGELTEPVVKGPEAVKPAAPTTKQASPAQPAEAAQTPARAEPKPAATRRDAEERAPTQQSPAEKRSAAPVVEDKQPATQEPRPKEHTPAAQAPAPAEVAAESSFTGTGARDALVYVEVGPAGVLSPGPDRLGPALDLLVSFKFRPYQTSSISLVGLIPLLNTDLTGNGASVDVQTWGIGGFGDLHLPLGRFELSAGLGGLALISTVLVTPAQGPAMFISDYPTQRLAALLGRVGASMALTRELHVSASFMAGLTVQQLRLEFPRAQGTDTSDTAPDASWGWPLLLGSVSLELALPWDR